MPLTPEQQTAAFKLLEGDQTDDEARGVEKMLTDFARARDRFRGLLDNLTGWDPEAGLFTVGANTGTHNDMSATDAVAALRRARNLMRAVANELDAYLENFTPNAEAPAGAEIQKADA